MSTCFHLEWFGFLGLESDKTILNEGNEAFAVFELTLSYLDAVSNLDLQLRIVSDGLV